MPLFPHLSANHLAFSKLSVQDNALTFDLFFEETGEQPVLLLDDVLSELDMKRQEFVLNRIGGGQTLITCCEDEGISSRTGGKVLFVEKGKIR